MSKHAFAVLAVLFVGSQQSQALDSAIELSFAEFSIKPPTTSSVTVCHGFGCNYRTEVGLSNADRTIIDSQASTILSAEEGHSAFEDNGSTHPDRARYFGKVEKLHTHAQEVEETRKGANLSLKQTRSASESGSSRGPKNPNMKRNVWEVRKK